MPPGLVTVTSTVPLPAGAVAVICVAELIVKAATVAPNWTPVASLKPVPVIVTWVPPPVGPAFGLTEVTVGAASYVYWSALVAVEVPPGVVTVT